MTPYDQVYQNPDPLFKTANQMFPTISAILSMLGVDRSIISKLEEAAGVSPGTTMRDPFRKWGDSYLSTFGDMDRSNRSDLVRSFSYSIGDWGARDAGVKNIASFLDSEFLERNSQAREAYEYALQSAGSGVSFDAMNRGQRLSINKANNRRTTLTDVDKFFRDTVIPFNPVMARGDAGTLAAEYIRANFNDISNYGLDINKAKGLNSDDFKKLLDKADSLVNTVSEINNTNKKADGTLSGSVRVVDNNGKLELSTTGKVSDSDLKRVTDQLKDVNTSLAAVADRVSVSVQSERAVDSAGNTTDATTDIKITTGVSADEIKRRAAETKSRFKQMQNAISQWQKVLDTDVIETIAMLSRSIGSNVLSTFGNAGRQLALNAGMVQHVGALTGRGSAYPLQAIQTANQMLASMGGDQANSMMVGLAASAWGNPASEYRLDRPQLEQRILATYAGNIESDTAKSVGALFSRIYQARKGDKGWTNVDEAIGSFENMMQNDAKFREAFTTNGRFDANKFNTENIRKYMTENGMDGSFSDYDFKISQEGTLSMEFRNKSELPLQIAAEGHLEEGRRKVFANLSSDVQKMFDTDDETRRQVLEAAGMEESAGAARIREIAAARGIVLKKGQETAIWDNIRGTLRADRALFGGYLGLSGVEVAGMNESEYLAYFGKRFSEYYQEAKARARVSNMIAESGGLRGAAKLLTEKGTDLDKATISAITKQAFGASAENEALIEAFGLGKTTNMTPEEIAARKEQFVKGVTDSEEAIEKYNSDKKNKEAGRTVSRKAMLDTLQRDYRAAVRSKDTERIKEAKRRYENFFNMNLTINDKGVITEYHKGPLSEEHEKNKKADMARLIEQSNTEAILERRYKADDNFSLDIYQKDGKGGVIKQESLSIDNATTTKEKTALALASALRDTYNENQANLEATQSEIKALEKRKAAAKTESEKAEITRQIESKRKDVDLYAGKMGAATTLIDKVKRQDLTISSEDFQSAEKLTGGLVSKRMLEDFGIDPQQSMLSVLQDILITLKNNLPKNSNS